MPHCMKCALPDINRALSDIRWLPSDPWCATICLHCATTDMNRVVPGLNHSPNDILHSLPAIRHEPIGLNRRGICARPRTIDIRNGVLGIRR